MLQTTLQSEFRPGTNLPDALSQASWRFLVSALYWRQLICVGSPREAELKSLASMSGEILVIESEALIPRIRSRIAAWELPNVQAITRAELATLDAVHAADLIWLTQAMYREPFLSDAKLMRDLCLRLRPEGAIYFEARGLWQNWKANRRLRQLNCAGLNARHTFWITPLRGQVRTAFPLDKRIAEYVFRSVLPGQSLRARFASHLGVALARAGLLTQMAPRRAHVLLRQPHSFRCPAYIQKIASENNIDLSHYQPGLSARGRYDANKTILFFFDRQSSQPAIVVKTTRCSRYNARLENEYRILSTLDKQQYVSPATYPKLRFFGQHAGLAVLGENAVSGEPFRKITANTPACPIAKAVVQWITQLGANSVRREGQPGGALRKLLNRFAAVYDPLPAETKFLEAQVARIAEASVPCVLQHGDLGTWNVLAREDHQIIVLDWEAGEPAGLPLWDLFYFLRSWVCWMGRSAGIGDSFLSFHQTFVRTSRLSPFLLAHIKTYCRQVGIAAELVLPLFYTCWMHRALKECTRLSKPGLKDGHYFNLLRHCIAEQHQLSQTLNFY